MAHASLDRAPVLLVADGFTGAERAFANHQWFDHAAMLAPVTKAAAKAVEPGTAAGPMAAALLAAALAAPRGPVLLELSGAAARAPAALPPPPGPARRIQRSGRRRAGTREDAARGGAAPGADRRAGSRRLRRTAPLSAVCSRRSAAPAS